MKNIHSFFLRRMEWTIGPLEWDVGLLVYLLFPFKTLLFHAEEGNNSNRKECKASLGFVIEVFFFLSHH